MKRMVNWIEIPVSDMERAILFYSKILGVKLTEMDLGNVRYALFPSEDRFNCGALAHGENYNPAPGGVTIYLDGGDDLAVILSKVKAAGGTVILEKTFLSKEAGHIGLFHDPEGNQIGLQHM